MRNATVFACVRVLSETVATLPGSIYRWLEGRKGKEEVPGHPLYRVLTFMANRYQTAMEWREMMVGHCALRGNAYSQIVGGRLGVVDQLIPLHPDRVQVEVNNQDGQGWVPAETATFGTAGVIRYVVNRRDGRQDTLLDEDVFHVRGLSSNGIMGISVISAAREAIGLGLATEGYGARFFSQDARPGGVLQTDQKVLPDTEERLAASWRRAHEGHERAHRVAILQQGLKWQQLGMTSEDAQFVETQKFTVAQIARFFRMQLHKIGDLERSTNNNIEHQGIEFSNDTILPWTVRFEQAFRRDLITADDRYFFKFNLEGLLRGDRLSRMQSHAIGLNWGVESPDEVRAQFDMNPRGDDEGLRYYRPLNMVLAGEDMSMDKRVEAAGQLVRAGYLPADALEAVGLPQLGHLGLPPVTVQSRFKPANFPGGGGGGPEDDDSDARADERQTAADVAAADPGPTPAPAKASGPGPAVLAIAENLHTQEVRWAQTWGPRLAKDPPEWRRKVAEFYGAHEARIVRRLGVDAAAYCASHRARLSESVAVIGEWSPAELVALLEAES